MSDSIDMTFSIRPLAPDDRPALEAMYSDFEPKRAAQGLPPEREEALRSWLDRVLDRGHHLVAELDAVVVGHAMLIPMESDVVELANFVHQSVRNRGLGTALNSAAVEIACTAGHRRVWLSVEPSNRPAVRSYERAGFRRLTGSLWAPEIEMAIDCESCTPAASGAV